MAVKDLLIKIGVVGAKNAESKVKGVDGALNKLGGAALKVSGAFFAAKGLIAGFSGVIEAAARQEQAEKALQVALGKTSQSLLKQASALQKVTTAGDEAIIEQQAFLASLKFTEDQIKTIIPVALDLSAATGISLESAVRNTSKTFSGLAGELGELVPQLRDLTQEEMKAGKAVEVLGELFEGQASKQAETLSGSLEQMSNAIGDAAEALGSLLSPVVVTTANAMKTLAEGVSNVIDRFKDFGKEIDAALLTPTEQAEMSLNKFKKSIKGLSETELLKLNDELNKQGDAFVGYGGIINQTGGEYDLIQDKIAAVIEEHKKQTKAIKEASTANQEKLEIIKAEKDFQVELVEFEKMTDAERLSAKEEFNLQMQSMFESDFNMQRVLMSEQAKRFREAGISEVNIARFTAEKKRKIRDSEVIHTAQTTAELIGIMKNASSTNKNLSKITQGLAYGEAVVKAYEASAKAYAKFGGFPQGVVPAALSFAFGMSQAEGIRSQKFASGGIVPGVDSGAGDTVPAMLTPGEVILNQAQQQNLVGGMGGVTINFNAPVTSEEFVKDFIVPEIEKTVSGSLA